VLSLAEHYMRTTLLGSELPLPGPTGERNSLRFAPRGAVLCAAGAIGVLLNQLAAVLATGNRAIVLARDQHLVPASLPPAVRSEIVVVDSIDASELAFQVALVDRAIVARLRPVLAGRDGPLTAVIDCTEEGPVALWRLVAERALCINTTAAGGNASLMTLGL
jgi:RHH-type proline utilization regulon transcriptional repressor/proline dehydrogenase/delta 1-pyrroline-5-carboxylate dehydrogenase